MLTSSLVQSGMGPQVLSDKRTNQSCGLGCGKRFNYDFVKRAKEQPGAGDYNQTVSCGKQQLSMKKSLPLYSFGTSSRDQAGKVYLTREHEKGQKGDCSPGPVTATSVRRLPSCPGVGMLSLKPPFSAHDCAKDDLSWPCPWQGGPASLPCSSTIACFPFKLSVSVSARHACHNAKEFTPLCRIDLIVHMHFSFHASHMQ
jgi:hypothetical protein